MNKTIFNNAVTVKNMLRSIGLSFFILFANYTLAADLYPNRPIRVMIGFAPGGSADTVARAMAPKMSELLKQSVVIENHPGAGGNIASEQTIRSAPDGYTIMLGTIGSLAVNQHLSKLSYDPAVDMQALSMAIVFSNVLVVNASSEIKTLDDYIRLGKLENSKLSFGSSGIGSAGHLAGEFFKITAGLNNQHVAYRGGAPAMNDLLSGVLPSIFSSPTDAIQFIQSGKLRALAVTGSKRLDVLAQIPTISELGYPGFEAVNWYAFTTPLKTPQDIVAKLNQVIVATLKDQSVATQLKKSGLNPFPTTSDEATKYIRAESEKWGGIVKKAGIRAE
jgi:tripartite-type tricarboxylate transporter receptor subunit TctC